MPAYIIRADARSLPLADGSVDLVVTSPPYYALRSYTDGGEHYAGQIGSEPTPQGYIAALIDCTREWMRVLKPTGSIFVDLGDKYSTGNSGESGMAALGERFRGGGHTDGKAKRRSRPARGFPPKSLLLLPERYRVACVDQLELIARAVVVWSKVNSLPESVQDRVRRSHEDWVHLTKQPRYYSAVDEIRESYAEPQRRGVLTWEQRRNRSDRAARYSDQNGHGGTAGMAQSSLGKLPGSVWEIATEPLIVPEHLGIDHFAAFPTEWPRRIILGWSPSGICVDCGEGRRPVVGVDRVSLRQRDLPMRARLNSERIHGPDRRAGTHVLNRSAIAGYACTCPEPNAPTRPSVILDPFGGTGTTALVAQALGRIGVSVDMSADYCRLATWRVNDPAQRAKALQVPAPPKVPEAQLGLFEVA